MNIFKRITPKFLRKKIEQHPDDVDIEVGIVDDVRLVELVKQLIENRENEYEPSTSQQSNYF